MALRKNVYGEPVDDEAAAGCNWGMPPDEPEILLRAKKDYLDENGSLPKWWANQKVGQEEKIRHGSPGVGHTTYEITRIDDEGVWAVYKDSFHRELTLRDVY